jgi:class 3 adenylate cyclase
MPNLAARLQALAAPNTLVIGEATRRQVGGLFDLADLGPQALAGFAAPQLAWRVIGESGILSRFEALRSGETPLVGRDEEIELLLRRWQQAKSGEGRVVLISGEPGMGDGVLIYFGYPHAHEDDAERAVRAGLAVIEAAMYLATKPSKRATVSARQRW